MLFSSLIFIWYFLPAVFILCVVVRDLKIRNLILLIASLFFYAWGEPVYVFLMMFSIFLNYLFGRLIESTPDQRRARILITLCVITNLGILGYFKYLNFFLTTLNSLLHGRLTDLPSIALPIGISFYTFQALSYVIDVYRRRIHAQKNLLNLALYISFFPQLIAGPIVKYYEIEQQLECRKVTAQSISYGIRRFSCGLAKKVILANTFAYVVDRVLLNPAELLDGRLIWFTFLLYMLQIYYDFSGYSDMAIGLGQMFGFRFMENFRYPYLSASIQEFWRRWHISLSTWFKEYLYIPLGGNRRGSARTLVNLFLVFLATGLWHGAGGNFLLWGIFHGAFIIMERLFLGKWLLRNPVKILNHLYAVTVVYFGWILFRVEDLTVFPTLISSAIHFKPGYYTIPMFADKRIFFYTILGLLLCGPVQLLFKKFTERLYDESRTGWANVVLMAVLMAVCTIFLVNDTYNPFIYFRF